MFGEYLFFKNITSLTYVTRKNVPTEKIYLCFMSAVLKSEFWCRTGCANVRYP